MDKKDETAKKPIPLYVYCTVIFLRTFSVENAWVLFLAPKADHQQIDNISICFLVELVGIGPLRSVENI